MNKEDKKLLIQDLYARLPYGFIIYRPSDNANLKISDIDDFAHFLEYSDREEFKPYLRPMSSMTEEEKDEYKNLVRGIVVKDYIALPHINQVDWLNKHHFDYRTDDEGKTMIEKGLALKAPEDMYKIE